MSEEIEDIKPVKQDKAAGGGGGGNPLIPILVVVVLMPVLSFVMAEFVLFPRMAKMFPAAEKDAHAEEHGDEHGDTSGMHKDEKGASHYFEFDNIVANLRDAARSRYVKVSFNVEGHDPEFEYIMKNNKVRLIDATISILQQLSLQDLEEPGVKNIVRNDLKGAFNSVLGGRVVTQVYFSEFVIQ